MFLQLDDKKLKVVEVTRILVVEIYKLTWRLPAEEKFAMASQLRRAVLSIHLNIAEGCSRRSAQERKRFFEIARGSLIEVDAALEIAIQLNYLEDVDLEFVEKNIISCFKLLSKLIQSTI